MKGLGLMGKMSDFRFGACDVQDEYEASCRSKSYSGYKKGCIKRIQDQLEGTNNGQR